MEDFNNFQKMLALLGVSIYFTFITVALANQAASADGNKCKEEALVIDCTDKGLYVKYPGQPISDVVKNYKLSKRFQFCDEQAGQVNSAKTNGMMREMQLPPYGRHLWANKAKAIGKMMENGALLADYFGIWILRPDLATKDCSNVENLAANVEMLQAELMEEHPQPQAFCGPSIQERNKITENGGFMDREVIKQRKHNQERQEWYATLYESARPSLIICQTMMTFFMLAFPQPMEVASLLQRETHPMDGCRSGLQLYCRHAAFHDNVVRGMYIDGCLGGCPNKWTQVKFSIAYNKTRIYDDDSDTNNPEIEIRKVEHYEVDEYGNFKLYFFSTSSLYERWRDDEFDLKCQDSAHWWKFVKSFWDNHFDKHANAESKESAHRKEMTDHLNEYLHFEQYLIVEHNCSKNSNVFLQQVIGLGNFNVDEKGTNFDTIEHLHIKLMQHYDDGAYVYQENEYLIKKNLAEGKGFKDIKVVNRQYSQSDFGKRNFAKSSTWKN